MYAPDLDQLSQRSVIDCQIRLQHATVSGLTFHQRHADSSPPFVSSVSFEHAVAFSCTEIAPIDKLPAEILLWIFTIVIPEWGNEDVADHGCRRNNLRSTCRRWYGIVANSSYLNAKCADVIGSGKLTRVDGNSAVILGCKRDSRRWRCADTHRQVDPAVLEKCLAIAVCPNGFAAIQTTGSSRLEALQEVCLLKVTGGTDIDLTFLCSAPRLKSLRGHFLHTYQMPKTPLSSLTRLAIAKSFLEVHQLLTFLRLAPHLVSFHASGLSSPSPRQFEERLPPIPEEHFLEEIQDVVLDGAEAGFVHAVVFAIPPTRMLRTLTIDGKDPYEDDTYPIENDGIFVFELFYQLLRYGVIQRKLPGAALTVDFDYGTISIHGPDLSLILAFGNAFRLQDGLAFFHARGGWPSSLDPLLGTLHVGETRPKTVDGILRLLLPSERQKHILPSSSENSRPSFVELLEWLPPCISQLLCTESSGYADAILLPLLQANPHLLPHLQVLVIFNPRYEEAHEYFDRSVSKHAVDALLAARPKVRAVHGTSLRYRQRECSLTEMLLSLDPSRRERTLLYGEHWHLESAGRIVHRMAEETCIFEFSNTRA